MRIQYDLPSDHIVVLELVDYWLEDCGIGPYEYGSEYGNDIRWRLMSATWEIILSESDPAFLTCYSISQVEILAHADMSLQSKYEKAIFKLDKVRAVNRIYER